jgi:NAD(P)-dependent dehydrogenase (short-subunit alcohol dehydrogenase family)
MPASGIYSATKAGMASIARTLSGELIGRGIRVNSVSPGPIATPLHDGETEDQRKQLLAQIPAGRMGRPSEVAEAVASNESAFTVGSESVIDDGMTNL